MVLEAPELANICKPGQFVHVLCGTSYDPLLRRPISIHDADPDTGQVVLLYEIRGRGTALLGERAAGDLVDLLGPLGNGFTMPSDSDQPVLLVGGGIGAAPIYFLNRMLAETIGCDKITAILGARTSDMLLCSDDFSRAGSAVCIATDDGTLGCKGFVTTLINEHIASLAEGSPMPLIYACGPTPMLKAVAQIANVHHISCQVSLEAKMACGVGACMSCVVKVHDGDSQKYVRVCKEGPVFNAEEVVW